ncbi:ABC transporter transmembrane domain-containing protein [Microvirga lotononidis]|uniref:ABC transporter transmembrane domain-containing protein n=1 Tax=Microvirga lotononidis TaxID=864069 RepID=UPI000306A23D|nr:ABC transporter ATP-binding protein [Microvirga lotononidis]
MENIGETPFGLFDFIIRASGWHQLGLALLSGLTFATAVVPLELQRRIINDTLRSHSARDIATLAGIYVAIALAGGVIKLIMNLYRSWVGESAVLHLRSSLLADLVELETEHQPMRDGIKVSLIMDEADPIGGFVGSCISEPLLQGGILVSVFGYLIHLQPLLASVTLLVFSPQLVFVPLMQQAINRRVSARIGALRQISIGIMGGYRHNSSPSLRESALVEIVFSLNMGVYKLKFSMNFLMNFMHQLGICAILTIGGYWVIHGKTEVGTIVAFLSGLNQINDPWGDLVNWFRDLQVTQTKYRRIVGAVLDLQAKGA